MKILVAGGAGYIGGHLVRRLAEQGHRAIVFDSLRSGAEFPTAAADAVRGDLTDRYLLRTVLRTQNIDAVAYCAGIHPSEAADRGAVFFVRANYVPFLSLVEEAVRAGIGAIVYISGTEVDFSGPVLPDTGDATVSGRLEVEVAAMAERTLRDLSETGAMRHVALRTGHVAGADPALEDGETRDTPRHFLGEAVWVAAGRRAALRIHSGGEIAGESPVREYVHIEDLTGALILCLEYLVRGGRSRTFECGYGCGFPDVVVAEKVKKIAGMEFPVLHVEGTAIAAASRLLDPMPLREELGWAPRFDDKLTSIIKTALRWERKLERTVSRPWDKIRQGGTTGSAAGG